MDTLALSYRAQAVDAERSITAAAEERKSAKYTPLSPNFIFMPLACETLGGWGPAAQSFIRVLGRRLGSETNETRSAEFSKQRLSMAVQRGNANSVLSGLQVGGGLVELAGL